MPVTFVYGNGEQRGDLVRTVLDGVETNLEVEGRELESAIDISLFTDRLADPGDRIPDESTDRRGWWADAFSDPSDDLIGSKVWVDTDDGKATLTNVRRVKEAIEDCLAWMIEDGVVDRVVVEGEILDAPTGLVGFRIRVRRPGLPAPRWETFWRNVVFD